MTKDPFASIKEALDRLRPFLKGLPVTTNDVEAHKNKVLLALNNLRKAAQEYAGRKKGKSSGDAAYGDEAKKADWLDSEGVALWSEAKAATRKAEDSDIVQEDHTVAAFVRLTAFSLVDASVASRPPSQEVAQKNLHMLCRTAVALLEANDKDHVSRLLIQGSDYEDSLKTAMKTQSKAEAQACAEHILEYHLTRIDAAIADDKIEFGQTFVSKALGEGFPDYQAIRLTIIEELDKNVAMRMIDLRRLAHKCWKIGDHLKNKAIDHALSAQLAVSWLEMALQVVERMTSRDPSDQMALDIKTASLQSLATALRLTNKPDGFAAAVAVLQQLVDDLGPNDVKTRHAIHIHELSVLKASSAGEKEVYHAIEKIIASMTWTAQSVQEVLVEINGITNSPKVQAQGKHHLLRAAVTQPEAVNHVGLIILNILWGLRSSFADDSLAAYTMARGALDILPPDWRLEHEVCTACQNTLWDLAETLEKKDHDWAEVAEWFRLVCHPSLEVPNTDTTASCLRKAAMCYLSGNDGQKAWDCVRQCPPNEASTQYVLFLTGLKRGDKQQVIAAIHNILKCGDLHGKQLMLMANLAHARQDDTILFESLLVLLDALQTPGLAAHISLGRLTILSCLVDVILKQLIEADDKHNLCLRLHQHLSLACRIWDDEIERTEEHRKTLKWIYSTVFNAAHAGIDSWEQDDTADIFDGVATLVERYLGAASSEVDPEALRILAMAKYSCFCGKLFEYKRMPPGEEKDILLLNLRQYAPDCQDAFHKAMEKSTKEGQQNLKPKSQLLSVFEIDLAARAGDWPNVDGLVEEHVIGLANEYLEPVYNLMVSYKDYPVSLLNKILEALIDVFSKGQRDLTRFALWIRAAVGLRLQQNGSEDDARSLHYARKALAVMQQPSKEPYPVDEAEWLLAESLNRASEHQNHGDFAGAKVWAELAMQFGQRVPQAKHHQPNIFAHYRDIMAHASN